VSFAAITLCVTPQRVFIIIIDDDDDDNDVSFVIDSVRKHLVEIFCTPIRTVSVQLFQYRSNSKYRE
jgi:hypothetical protein